MRKYKKPNSDEIKTLFHYKRYEITQMEMKVEATLE